MKPVKKAIGGLTLATLGTEPIKSIRSPVTRVPAMAQVSQTDQIINRMGNQLRGLVGRRVSAMEDRPGAIRKAEGGKVGAVKKAVSAATDLKKLNVNQLNKRRIALESLDDFYDDAKNAQLKSQWQAIHDEAARRGITLVDDQ